LLKEILLVGLGGFIGSISRYLCHKLLKNVALSEFPLGTFTVNLTGCFLIGLFFGFAGKHEDFNQNFRLLMMTGFCGGFTTFSAFTLEGMQLLTQQRFLIFTLYFVASVMLGLIATFLGFRLTE
jgi:fluoride exporter